MSGLMPLSSGEIDRELDFCRRDLDNFPPTSGFPVGILAKPSGICGNSALGDPGGVSAFGDLGCLSEKFAAASSGGLWVAVPDGG